MKKEGVNHGAGGTTKPEDGSIKKKAQPRSAPLRQMPTTKGHCSEKTSTKKGGRRMRRTLKIPQPANNRVNVSEKQSGLGDVA